MDHSHQHQPAGLRHHGHGGAVRARDLLVQEPARRAHARHQLPGVFIQVQYPGASPEAVENDVTKPVEEVVNTVNGVKTHPLQLVGRPQRDVPRAAPGREHGARRAGRARQDRADPPRFPARGEGSAGAARRLRQRAARGLDGRHVVRPAAARALDDDRAGDREALPEREWRGPRATSPAASRARC